MKCKTPIRKRILIRISSEILSARNEPFEIEGQARSTSSSAEVLLVVNTGIAHRGVGVGEVGTGITRALLECFTKAVTALTLIPFGG